MLDAVANVLSIAILAGVLYWWTRRADRAPIIARRVIVNLLDGTAVRGVLTSQPGPWLVLHDADLLRADNAAGPVRMDGAVYIERPRVLFVQVVP